MPISTTHTGLQKDKEARPTFKPAGLGRPRGKCKVMVPSGVIVCSE